MIRALAWFYDTLFPLLGNASFALFGVQGPLLILGDSGISLLHSVSLVEKCIVIGHTLIDYDEEHKSQISQQPVRTPALAAEQVGQPLPNRWDRLPRELQLLILRFAGPLTRFLCGDEPTLAETKSANGFFHTLVWCDAFKLEWQGDLARLPEYAKNSCYRCHTPRLHRRHAYYANENCLEYVQTRSMYERLCLVAPNDNQPSRNKDRDRLANVYGDEAVVNNLDDQLQQGVEALQLNPEDGPAPVENPR
ncbi:hypothetical protein BC831DRAFT_512805 [Entophlyctis helioformis]|nr:hypothetical protein BC831DRAFT_512805 [Entophlyctis helioformis]